MREFIGRHFEHVLCALLLVSRVGDVVTTYLATPKLRLEANPVVRKLKWPFAFVSLLACLIPYYHTGLGVAALVFFLSICASNAAKVWFIRAMGEGEYLELLHRIARSTQLWRAILSAWVSAGFVALMALVVWFLYPGPDTWGFWIALGLMNNAVATVLFGSLFLRRIFRTARAQGPGAGSTPAGLVGRVAPTEGSP